MKMLPTSAVVLLTLTATACTQMMTPEVTATGEAMCDAWEDSLPTRSHDDTEQTRREIGRAYDVFEAVCDRAVG